MIKDLVACALIIINNGMLFTFHLQLLFNETPKTQSLGAFTYTQSISAVKDLRR